MNKTVLKSFGTGQVTLPKAWREKFDTKYFVAVIQDDQITLKPLIDDAEGEEVFFDSKEFDDGKGVAIQDFHKALKKSLKNG